MPVISNTNKLLEIAIIAIEDKLINGETSIYIADPKSFIPHLEAMRDIYAGHDPLRRIKNAFDKLIQELSK